MIKPWALACTFALSLPASLALAAAPGGTLQAVAEFGARQPVGVTFSEQGRLFLTFPRQSGAKEFRYAVAEIVDGQERPYPNAAWNTYRADQPADHFMNAHAVVAQGDKLWVLDSASPAPGGPAQSSMKLLRIDLGSAQVERVYRFEDIDQGSTALNDVRIDPRRNLAYLSDPKRAAIVVLDLKTGTTRSVLAGQTVTRAEPGYRLHIDGQDVVDAEGKPFSSDVNGIALTADGQWFYFRAINQDYLYRVATADLANPALSDTQLASRVERVAKVGVSHGMLADQAGNVYLSDSIHYAVNRWSPDGSVTRLVSDPRLSWPDTFALDPAGNLYLTAAQLNRTGKYSATDRTEYPYRLYKVVSP
ncbi:SMP-30/gluconolactonase/LRE family protein [Pseudomonas sp. nanlin1]|uniref:SMP-30/gluconolactonase/LRE family protein n=1 Tax=Pseudomonas sp. nanlin1 TaxID=3040605 RepID=UPI00388E4AF0